MRLENTPFTASELDAPTSTTSASTPTSTDFKSIVASDIENALNAGVTDAADTVRVSVVDIYSGSVMVAFTVDAESSLAPPLSSAAVSDRLFTPAALQSLRGGAYTQYVDAAYGAQPAQTCTGVTSAAAAAVFRTDCSTYEPNIVVDDVVSGDNAQNKSFPDGAADWIYISVIGIIVLAVVGGAVHLERRRRDRRKFSVENAAAKHKLAVEKRRKRLKTMETERESRRVMSGVLNMNAPAATLVPNPTPLLSATSAVPSTVVSPTTAATGWATAAAAAAAAASAAADSAAALDSSDDYADSYDASGSYTDSSYTDSNYTDGSGSGSGSSRSYASSDGGSYSYSQSASSFSSNHSGGGGGGDRREVTQQHRDAVSRSINGGSDDVDVNDDGDQYSYKRGAEARRVRDFYAIHNGGSHFADVEEDEKFDAYVLRHDPAEWKRRQRLAAADKRDERHVLMERRAAARAAALQRNDRGGGRGSWYGDGGDDDDDDNYMSRHVGGGGNGINGVRARDVVLDVRHDHNDSYDDDVDDDNYEVYSERRRFSTSSLSSASSVSQQRASEREDARAPLTERALPQSQQNLSSLNQTTTLPASSPSPRFTREAFLPARYSTHGNGGFVADIDHGSYDDDTFVQRHVVGEGPYRYHRACIRDEQDDAFPFPDFASEVGHHIDVRMPKHMHAPQAATQQRAEQRPASRPTNVSIPISGKATSGGGARDGGQASHSPVRMRPKVRPPPLAVHNPATHGKTGIASITTANGQDAS
jgi:hypothetical protein